MEIIKTIKALLREKDPLTEQHLARTEILAVKFADYLNDPVIELERLGKLAYFHDLGKIGIPNSILLKKGPLTAEEYGVMQGHSLLGWKMALAIPELAPVADPILKHHEWWNGKGYPLGLRGEEIPLESRLIAIIDAYDAMTNVRTYRQAVSPEEAVEEIRKCAGTQFDPLLALKFADFISYTEKERYKKVGS